MKKIAHVLILTGYGLLFNILMPVSAVNGAESGKSIYKVEKPMGEVRTRFNVIEPIRTPLTELPFKEINERSFVPARIRREGFIPRFSVVEEYNDNILFLPEDKIEDIITIISPGFNFVHHTKRSQLELDYSFESTIYPQNSKFNQAFETHSLLFNGRYQLNQKSLISFTNSFFSFKDRTNQVIPGASQRSRIFENFFNSFFSYRLTKEINLMLGYSQILNTFDDQSLTNSLIHDGYVSFSTVLTPQDVIELEYRFRYIDFELQSAVPGAELLNDLNAGIHFISIRNTHDFSETLALSGKVGIVEISNPISSTNFIASVSLTKSIKDSVFEIRYDRDFSTTGGFNTLLQGDTVSTSVNSALLNRLYGKLKVNLSRFRQMYNAGITVQMIEPSLTLEYKLSKNLQFRLSYHYLYQQINVGNIVTDSNKLNLGIVVGF